MKVRSSWYVYLVLAIVMITYIVFIFNENTDIETKLDEVKLKTEINEISKNSFAIMVEKEDGSGYEEVDNFPEGLPLNEELTGCIDIDGKSLDNVISYSEGVVTVHVNSTAYCYLYFNLGICEKESNLGECIHTAKTNGYNSNLEGGLYRYQGAKGLVDNYICFGTNDKEECINNSDAYLYRIIGVDSNNKIKIIKEKDVGKMQWYSEENETITWPNSLIYTNLNGSFFLTNTTYVPSGWENKIETYSWKYGDITDANQTASSIYVIENAWTNNVDAKIGLMYAHDFAYAYQSGGLNCGSATSSDWQTCGNAWINKSDWDDNETLKWEVIMTYSVDYPMNITPGGAMYSVGSVSEEYYVRPVFYLSSSTAYNSGSGTINDPFIIEHDTTPPTNNSITINSGAEDTNSTNVTLTLSSTEATEMCISNTNSCNSWETYSTTKSWSLTSGKGTKTVYVWYRDKNGNTSEYVTDTIISNAITYLCTSETSLSTCLQSAKTTGFNPTLEGGLYRYQGTSVDNYVCFGTTDSSECLENTDAHLYRIIGVTNDNKVKLIKREALNSTSKWYTSNSTNITWPNSTLYTNINGNTFLTNETYIPNGWNDKLADTSWKYGNNGSVKTNANTLYNTENSWTDTVDAKIGLMYLHDYYYAYQSGGVNCSGSGPYGNCKTSWIHLSVCDSEAPSTIEWTMSQHETSNYVWAIHSSGYSYDGIVNSERSVRPVFFLTSSVKYISGSGTATDPFIIS